VVLLANGSPVAGVIEAEVLSNNHFAADRFGATLALDADPASASFWASAGDVSAEIRMSLDGLAFVSLIQGAVDSIDIDLTYGQVRLEGRDLTAALIESRTQETFANRTSSEIARIMAERHALTPEVTDTKTPVGRYYQNEHDRITLNQFSRAMTEWDLLVFLAQQEGFDVFVQGTTLHFEPSSASASRVLLTPDAVMALRLERALTLARDIEVTVKSWNSRQRNAFEQTARVSGRGKQAVQPQRYVFVRPNLTEDQALQLAQRKLAELTRHERTIAVTMPGELAITPRSIVELAETGTDFDRPYYVDVIERRLSVQSGFTQHLRCKNVNPTSQATPPADIVASVAG
jgi:phage protein D